MSKISPRIIRLRKILITIFPFLVGIYISGCTTVQEPPEPSPEIEQVKKLLIQNKNLQEKIKQLEEKLVEKDALIKSLNIREQDQTQALQATSNEVVKTQAKLHRLATKSGSASQIAEAEVGMARIKRLLTLPADQRLMKQAQRLLDAAVSFYTQDDYAAAMNYASQTSEFVDMLDNQDRKHSDRSLVAFNVPIKMKITTDANLRREPGINGKIIGVLQKGSIVQAIAYRGNWLRVQTNNENQGWVSNKLIETIVD